MDDRNSVQKLLASLREVTSTAFKKHESSNAVKFIKASINKIDSIIKTLDKMLKRRNIDVGAYAAQTKQKGMELLEKGKALAEEVKTKGFLNTVKEKGVELRSKLVGLFKEENETSTSPPEESKKEEVESSKTKKDETNENDADDDKSVEKSKKKLSKTEKEEAETKENRAKAEEKREKKKSIFSNLFSKSTERANKRKKEVEEEKKAIQENKDDTKSDGWVDKILKAVGLIGGVIGKGIVLLKTGIGVLGKTIIGGLSKALGWAGGFIVGGVGKFITGLVPAFSASIAGLVSTLVGGGIKAAGSLISKGAIAAGKAVRPVLGGAARLVGRAALMAASGPIGWVVAGATAIYAGYEIYKHLTRNNIANDFSGKLTRLRLLMYGFNDIKRDHYFKVFNLEMMMKSYTRFVDYKVVVDRMSEADINRVLDIFGVSKQETDKYNILNTWFIKRFMPAYKSFMQALWSVNSRVFLDDIDKLKPLDVYNFVTRITVPTIIYDTQVIPTYNDTTVYVIKNDIDQMLINIINQSKDVAKQKDPDQTLQIAEENKRRLQQQTNQKDSKQIAEENKRKLQQQTNQRNLDQTKSGVTALNSGSMDSHPGDADSQTDATGNITNEVRTKVTKKINQASGVLAPGSMSLEGIGLNSGMTKEKIYNLDPNVRDLFTGMAREYHLLTGEVIPVNQAFRSFEDQASLHARMPDRAARPGNSTHEFGLALDISSDTANELDRLGLMRKYGFTRPIGGEMWHIEPAGVSLNPVLARNDVNHRVKAILASPGRGGDGYGARKNSRPKRRNAAYQLEIYNKNNSVIIDPVNSLSSVNTNLSPTANAVQSNVETSKPQQSNTIRTILPTIPNITKTKPLEQSNIINRTSSINETVDKFTNNTSVNTNLSPTANAVQSNVETSKPQQSNTIRTILPTIPNITKTKPLEQSNIINRTSSINETVDKFTNNTIDADIEGETEPPNVRTNNINRNVSTIPINSNISNTRSVSLTPREAIRKAAKRTGMNEQTMLAYAKMESSLRGGNIKNRNSSAIGLFQIVDDTWESLLIKHGPKHGIPANATPDNNYYNALLAMEYAKDNLKRLGNYSSAGINQATAVYIAHHFGLTGARNIINALKQNPNSLMSDVVSRDTFISNRDSIENHTIKNFINNISNKIIKKGGSTSAITETTIKPNISPNTNTTSNIIPMGITKDSGLITNTNISNKGNNNPIDMFNRKNQTNNPVFIDRDNRFQRTIYIPEQSPYKTINTMVPAMAPMSTPIPQQNSIMNLKNIEGYMQNQVNLLDQIANILISINEKFDLEKFKQIVSGDNKLITPSVTNKLVPKSAVNLSRKSINNVI